jgi:predicted nucleic acid-binding Zn ribbon protein
MEKDTNTPCIACGEEIPAQAKICSKCSSHQSAWKNSLSYIASVIGVFSVVLGAIAFIISSIPNIQQVVSWYLCVKLKGVAFWSTI